jgi:hypothetical protein
VAPSVVGKVAVLLVGELGFAVDDHTHGYRIVPAVPEGNSVSLAASPRGERLETIEVDLSALFSSGSETEKETEK